MRTLHVVDRNRADVLSTKAGELTARYDRPLVLEIWYPATLGPGQTSGGQYETMTVDPAIKTTLQGQAVRDAAPVATTVPFPLVIISHGYPGNRHLLSHLGENLASKGQQAFASTLYNRPLDQLFVLNEMARLAHAGSGSFLSGRVDVHQTGIVGYSMGGYGVVNVIGAGFSEASLVMRAAPPNGLLGERAANSAEYRASIDPRIKAAIAIGPWGMQAGLWDAEGLHAVRTPVLFVAGSVDDVSGYERGTRALFEGTGTPNDTSSRSSTRPTTPLRRTPRRSRSWAPTGQTHRRTRTTRTPSGTPYG